VPPAKLPQFLEDGSIMPPVPDKAGE